MSRRSIIAIAALTAAVLSILAAANDAAAIPAFARKYQISCTTCHAPFPRLKPYGEEFAGRGFRMEPAQEPARATYDVGDPWLLLPRDLPLAVRLEGYASWKEDARASTDFEWPWVWKILSGGPIGSDVSYYFYFLLERGEVVGLEDAYLQINGIFHSGINLMAGQFQVCDPLFKRELRLERFDYQIYTVRVGQNPVNLAYDRGLILTGSLPGAVDGVLQVLNGNGIDAAEADGVSDFRNFDQDEKKALSLRLARGVGPARLGGFAYYGRTEAHGTSKGRCGTLYIGPDLVLDAPGGRGQLNAQFLYREDDNPYFSEPVLERKAFTRGGFVEAHWFPRGEDGRWALSGLYSRVSSSDDAADRETVSLTVNRLLHRNIRLVLEGGRDLEAEAARFSLGLAAAF